ncbi:YceI family protein [Desulfobaculum bizertense]|uniref:YceI family protein n=1 Tax=Desulfobaculum bizertense TaxID=376490 RepID=UPI001F40B02E|nr:YceI family protein [Desulfobaculum bizertense]UIJ37679.1 YceI family protein [Desulfobaculum bizertense]
MKKRFQRLSAEELQKWRSTGEEFTLVDVLLPELHQAKRIPEAENACVFDMEFVEMVLELVESSESRVVLYGESEDGRDAVIAAEKLDRQGFRNVWILAGGLWGWVGKGLETTGTERIPKEEGLLLFNGQYELSRSQSLIHWAGRNAKSVHTGTLRASRGQIDVRDGGLTGSFTIPLNTMRNTDLEDESLKNLLILHLLSDDFFFADEFPEARYHISGASPVEGASPGMPNYEIRGELELRGERLPLPLLATVSNLEERNVSIAANFDFDRTQWGVVYGSGRLFARLGYHLVFDLISIDLHVLMKKKDEAHGA